MAIADAPGALDGALDTRRAARRYDLDWLRVIAFGLLIFYHVGMFYVRWDWHVKSVYAGPAAEPLMLLVNPWRLALLFFISGVAVRFATDKASSPWAFAGARLYRLGLPVLMGMIVVVAPQSYFELRQAGAIEPGYLAFWGNYLKLEQLYPMITPTWNHLWYVVYLLVYILLITPVLPLLRRFAEGAGATALGAVAGGPVRLLLLITIPFIIYEMTLTPHFPTTHNLVNDWANHAHRFTIFMLGDFAAKHAGFWRSVDRVLPLA
ncbi:acyltransferase family protein, partial [Hyphococcus sp.]|uniref:acyltransferase family protein n=1 Tax=Hyphococcus sp. TaxID=2038636 RepID=UPI0035C75E54